MDEQIKKKRGRPAGNRTTMRVQDKNNKPSSSSGNNNNYYSSNNGAVEDAGESTYLQFTTQEEEQRAFSIAEEQLSPFSSALRKIIGRDRSEIIRLAQELDVADNTIYRWMNGSSEPRTMHLKRLLEVLPLQRDNLSDAIYQTFGSVPEAPLPSLRDVSRECYQRVLELLSIAGGEKGERFWQMIQAIFDSIITHLDPEKRGLAITFARLMPPQTDGIHSLRELTVRGTGPWPRAMESMAYLGSTTLTGTAIELQRPQLWNDKDLTHRGQVEVDEHEKSACVVPIMRGHLISGALIISSTQSTFFVDPMAKQIAIEYANLVNIALADTDFYPLDLLRLRPMPPLPWQRQQLALLYNQRILHYVRSQHFSRLQAEEQVQRDLEKEFEEYARHLLPQVHPII